MKKHFLLVIGMIFCCSHAQAQVEPRVAGEWKVSEGNGQPAKVLHIGSDGRYQMTSAGQVVDSGRITASEGAVTLQSESGKREQGRFSMLGGELKMHGGSIEGSWSRGGSGSNFSPKSISPTMSPAVPVGSQPSFSPSMSTSSQSSSSSQAVPPSKAIWGSVSESHASSPAHSSSSSSPVNQQASGSVWSEISNNPASAPTNSDQSKPGNSVWNSISNSGGSAGSGGVSSVQTSASPSQNGQTKTSTGNKIFNFVKNNLNAVNDAASSLSPGSTTTGGSYSSSGYSGSNNARANAFVTPTAAQRYYGSGSMPRRSTSAGIPVMKDGTARRIRFGR